MASRNVIIEEGKAENGQSVNFSKMVHPRVTAKKTYFDVHRNHRSNMEARKNDDGSFHPPIQWSAGSTDVGGRNKNHRILNTTPILKSVKSTNSTDKSQNNTEQPRSKRRLPPIPNTWGAIDAQPTQPEEINHLIKPSAVLGRTEIPQNEIPTIGKTFLEKFRKNAAKVIVAKRLERRKTRDSRLIKENDDAPKPKEEFRLLNESYVHEGILPEIFQSTSSSAALKDSKLSPMDGDGRRGFSSVEEKGVKIDSGHQDYFHTRESEERNGSPPLPARRSCVPLDVKELRKLRGPDQRSYNVVEKEIATGSSQESPHTISDSENDPDPTKTAGSVTDESGSVGREEDHPRGLDRFRIDNPFSDFSLQTLGQDKSVPKPHAMDRKRVPLYIDKAQPSTSKGLPSIHQSSLDPSDIIEHLESKNLEENLLEYEASGTSKSSLLDIAVTIKSSQRKFGERKVRFSELSEESRTILQLRNVWSLGPSNLWVLEKIFEICYVLNSKQSYHILRRNYFSDGPENIRALKTNALMPLLAVLNRNCLTISPTLTGNIFEHLATIIIQNDAWKYTTHHSTLLYPSIIFYLTDNSGIREAELRNDYIRDLRRDELNEIIESLRSLVSQENYPFLTPAQDACKRGNLMGNLIQYIVKMILSQNPDVHSSSFGPIVAQMATKDSVRDSKYSMTFLSLSQSPLLVNLISHCTPFVVYLEKFFDIRQNSSIL